jgi:hypothetical protein
LACRKATTRRTLARSAARYASERLLQPRCARWRSPAAQCTCFGAAVRERSLTLEKSPRLPHSDRHFREQVRLRCAEPLRRQRKVSSRGPQATLACQAYQGSRLSSDHPPSAMTTTRRTRTERRRGACRRNRILIRCGQDLLEGPGTGTSPAARHWTRSRSTSTLTRTRRWALQAAGASVAARPWGDRRSPDRRGCCR